jgi:hypothetical protein
MAALAAFGNGQFARALDSFRTFASPTAASPVGSLQASLNTAILGNSAEQLDVMEEAFMWAALRSGEFHVTSNAAWRRIEVLSTKPIVHCCPG